MFRPFLTLLYPLDLQHDDTDTLRTMRIFRGASLEEQPFAHDSDDEAPTGCHSQVAGGPRGREENPGWTCGSRGLLADRRAAQTGSCATFLHETQKLKEAPTYPPSRGKASVHPWDTAFWDAPSKSSARPHLAHDILATASMLSLSLSTWLEMKDPRTSNPTMEEAWIPESPHGVSHPGEPPVQKYLHWCDCVFMLSLWNSRDADSTARHPCIPDIVPTCNGHSKSFTKLPNGISSPQTSPTPLEVASCQLWLLWACHILLHQPGQFWLCLEM